MSIQAIGWVLENSRSSGHARNVLISIANHASATGGEAFPSVQTIARESNCSDRTVQRALTELVDLGELAYVRSGAPSASTRGDRRSNLYWLPGMPGTQGPGLEYPQGCQTVTPPGPHGVTTGPKRGDRTCANGVTLLSPKPSYEPSKNRAGPLRSYPQPDGPLVSPPVFGTLEWAEQHPSHPSAEALLIAASFPLVEHLQPRAKPKPQAGAGR